LIQPDRAGPCPMMCRFVSFCCESGSGLISM
jgi:hypothetical protein